MFFKRITDLNDNDVYATVDERFVAYAEAVITEIAGRTSRSLYCDETSAEAMRHLFERGISPENAAKTFIRELGWVESTGS